MSNACAYPLGLLVCWAITFNIGSALAREVISPRDLVEIRDLSGVSTSPNGAYAVVRMARPSIGSNGIDLSWYLVSLGDSPDPKWIADAGKISLGENGVAEEEVPAWSGDSQWIYYRALRNEQMQIWRSRWDGTRIEQITHDEANVVAFILDEADGQLFYSVGATRKEIIQAEQEQYDQGIFNDGSLLPGFPVVRSFPILGRPSTYRRYRDIEAGSGDRHAGLLAEQPERLIGLSLQTRRIRPTTAADAERFHSLMLERHNVNAPRNTRCDAACKITGAVIGGNRYGTSDCGFTKKEAICVVSASAQPPRLLAISISDGRSRVLFDPNAHIKPAQLGAVELLSLRNMYGEETTGILVTPNNGSKKRLPLVITSYTCDGFLRGGSGDDVPEHILAGFGIVAICINDNSSVRRAAIGGPRQEAHQKSSLAFRLAAVDLLGKRGLIDAQRVAVTGLSYGATSTLYAISHSDLFAAAVITSQGYDDPLEAYLYGASNVYRDMGASPFLNPDYYSRISPALNATKIRTPLLMQLSDTEYLQMMQLYSNLRDLDKPVEMFIYPDEYHVKHQPRHRLAVYEKTIAWVRFWLQGYEERSTPLEPMYKRWRAMRELDVERTSLR